MLQPVGPALRNRRQASLLGRKMGVNLRAMGIDFGDSRIGIAISDPLGWTASGLCVVDGKQGRKKVLSELSGLIREYGVTTVVVGYPLNMNGSKGERAEKTDRFLSDLQAVQKDVLMVQWDERLTTVAADRLMLEMGISQRQKGKSDMIAATLILQGYLDRNYQKGQKES